jgi:membrane protein YdbS with pleckstrin-like domain
MWWLVGGLVALAVGLPALVIALAALSSGDTVIAVVAIVVGIAVAVGAIVGPSLHYRSWRWELTDEGLELSHGVLLRVESSIPAFRVQQIDVRQGPLERAFGLVTLRLTTASSGSDGTLPGIAADHAEEVRRLLLARVADHDGV